jgi:hypothetical protein
VLLVVPTYSRPPDPAFAAAAVPERVKVEEMTLADV